MILLGSILLSIQIAGTSKDFPNRIVEQQLSYCFFSIVSRTMLLWMKDFVFSFCFFALISSLLPSWVQVCVLIYSTNMFENPTLLLLYSIQMVYTFLFVQGVELSLSPKCSLMWIPQVDQDGKDLLAMVPYLQNSFPREAPSVAYFVFSVLG